MVRSALLRFTVLSVAAMVVLGAAAVILSRSLAQGEALRGARHHTRLIASGLAAPLVDRALREGDPTAQARFGEVMRQRMLDGSVTHIKVWEQDGTVAWSDQTALVGVRFDLPDAVKSLFGTERDLSQLSRSDRSDSIAERHEGKLLEVYVGQQGSDGQPFVFEAYVSPDLIEPGNRAALAMLIPLALGTLLLLLVVVLPLGFSLARRVERDEQQRSELLVRSLRFWHTERRRLALELHDGVVQDLAGASYAMRGIVDALPPDGGADSARATGERLIGLFVQDLGALRALITDLTPTELSSERLADALEELVSAAAEEGLEVHLTVQASLESSSVVNGLAYRVVREGLRNVVKHADSSTATVVVNQETQALRVQVADRGCGPDPESMRDHFGVSLLSDLLHDMGGSLELRTGQAGGAVLDARIPTTLVI